MRSVQWLVVFGFALVFCLAAPASAQVYKCKDPAGKTIYSDKPCSGDPDKVETVKVRQDQATRDTSYQSSMAQMQDQTSRQNISYQTGLCTQNATGGIYRSANERITQLEARIAVLQAQTRRANNNLAGATWEGALRTEIAGLQEAISTERATSEAMAQAARLRCEDDERRKLEALDRERQARESEAKPAASEPN